MPNEGLLTSRIWDMRLISTPSYGERVMRGAHPPGSVPRLARCRKCRGDLHQVESVSTAQGTQDTEWRALEDRRGFAANLSGLERMTRVLNPWQTPSLIRGGDQANGVGSDSPQMHTQQGRAVVAHAAHGLGKLPKHGVGDPSPCRASRAKPSDGSGRRGGVHAWDWPSRRRLLGLTPRKSASRSSSFFEGCEPVEHGKRQQADLWTTF